MPSTPLQLPTPPDLEPMTEPYAFMNQPLLSMGQWLAIIAAAAVIALSVWLLLTYRKNKRPAVPPLTPAQSALEKISRLASASPNLKTASSELSYILREYITGHTQDPTLYETHQEFNRRARVLSNIPQEQQIAIRDLLQQMADYKYTAHVNDNADIVAQWIQKTEQLIQQIESEKLTQNQPSQPIGSSSSPSL